MCVCVYAMNFNSGTGVAPGIIQIGQRITVLLAKGPN